MLKGPRRRLHGRQEGADRRRPRRALLLEDLLLRAGLPAHARRRSRSTSWKLDFGEIAQIWRGGCIIRARFLQKITEAYAREPSLANLLLDPYFNEAGAEARRRTGARSWRSAAQSRRSPVPAFMSALAYYDGYRSAAPAGQPAPGAARLLRRAHLRARRPAARQVLPHRLARPEAAADRGLSGRFRKEFSRQDAKTVCPFGRAASGRRRFTSKVSGIQSKI